MKSGIYHVVLPVTLLALGGAACSNVRVNPEGVKAVKSVAIVGFGVQQRMPNTGESVAKSLFTPKEPQSPSGMPAMKVAEIAHPAPHATKMYDDLDRMMHLKLKWNVLHRDRLASSAAYRRLFAEKTRMPQSRPFVSGPNISVFTPQGIVEDHLLASMSMDERRALIRDLGVNAIAVVGLRIELDNEGGLKKLVGAGELHPRATAAVRVYDAAHEDPIWVDIAAEGKATSEGTEHALGFADVDAVNTQAVLAADDAFARMIARSTEN